MEYNLRSGEGRCDTWAEQTKFRDTCAGCTLGATSCCCSVRVIALVLGTCGGGVREIEVRASCCSREHQNTQEHNSHNPEKMSGIMKERPVVTQPMHSQNLSDQAANPSDRIRPAQSYYLDAVIRHRATTVAGERLRGANNPPHDDYCPPHILTPAMVDLDARTPEREPEGFRKRGRSAGRRGRKPRARRGWACPALVVCPWYGRGQGKALRTVYLCFIS